MPTRKILTIAIASAALSGCVPIPNLHYFAPAVSGVVMRGDVPVAGAEVFVSGAFSKEVRVGSTDREGRFSTESIRELRLTAFILGDPLYGYTVKIVDGGETYDGFAWMAVGDGPKEVKMVCDLSRPIQVGSAHRLCRWDGVAA